MKNDTSKIVSGAMILSLSGLIVKIISVFYRIPLTRMVGVDAMGYYHTAYPLYLFMTAMALVGIPNSLAKLIAEERARGDYGLAHQTFRVGFVVSAIFGILVSFLMLLLSRLTSLFNWQAETSYVIIGLSLAPFFLAMSGAIRGYFQGLQDMVPTAISQVIENIIKVIFGLLFVYLLIDRPMYIAIAGSTLGISLGFVFSFLYLLTVYYKKKDIIKAQLGVDDKKEPYRKSVKKIISIALPVTMSSAALSIMGLIDSTTIYKLFEKAGSTVELAKNTLGQIGACQTIINVPLVISVGLVASIVPAVAKARSLGDQDMLDEKINESFNLAFKFALPSAIGILIFSRQILDLLYHKQEIDHIYLIIYALVMLIMIISQTSTGILQGLSGHKKALYSILIASLVKILFNYLLINNFLLGYGVLLSSLGYYLTILIVNSYYVKKLTKYKINIKYITKPLFSAIIMGILSYINYLVLKFLTKRPTLSLLLAVFIAMLIYLILMLVIGGFTKDDILILPAGEKILKKLKKIGIPLK